MRNDEINLLILSKIERLKRDDYKIIKCFEALMSSKPMPYPFNDLIIERDKLRAEINDLEKRKQALDESGKEYE